MWRNGSRTRLRIWRLTAWGFESLHPHHKAEKPFRFFREGFSLYGAEAIDEGDLLQFFYKPAFLAGFFMVSYFVLLKALIFTTRPHGEIGKRCGLRSRWCNYLGSSSLPAGTIKQKSPFHYSGGLFALWCLQIKNPLNFFRGPVIKAIKIKKQVGL
jgi:hypothetical protein